MRDNPSPYAEFAACTESRVIALTRVKNLLIREDGIKKWMLNPGFGFKYPEIVLKKEAILEYRCPSITVGLPLQSFVFWDFKEQNTNLATALDVCFNTMEEYMKPLEDGVNKSKDESDTFTEDDGHEREFWENDAMIST